MTRWLAPAVFAALIFPAFARDLGQWQYAAPDIREYFASLMQPDNPRVSCCGEADAYWADQTDTGPNGELIAIITDTRDDGPLKRAHVAVGTRIVIPPSKIRRHPIPNPTGHTLVFLGAYGNVYCYEPLPGM